MIVLGVDTTSPYCSVALLKDGACVAESCINNGNTHSEILLPEIKRCLDEAGLSASDIDLFALSSCPGSFTGVRIGAATVKGLAFGMNKVCVGVSTLEALAYNLADVEGFVVPVMDARRNQFYNAIFKCKNGVVTRLTEDRLISSEALLKELEQIGEQIYLVGDGYDLARKNIKYDKILEIEKEKIAQSGKSVAILGQKVYNESQNKESFNDLELKPGYLRASQAERERNEKIKG